MPPHGMLGPHAAHLAIDMQRLFAEPGEWHVAGLAAITPQVAALARRWPSRTVFTRFVVPPTAAHANGAWQRFYRFWPEFTALPAETIALVPELAALADEPPLDKRGYSAFGAETLHPRLRSLGITTLIVSGVETDVCVLSTVLRAVDLGYRVVVAADATASSSRAGHDATLAHILPRIGQQVEIADTARILSAAG